MSGAGRLSVCAVALSIGLAACSDILGNSDQALTRKEVEALYHGIWALSRDTTLTVISVTNDGAVLEYSVLDIRGAMSPRLRPEGTRNTIPAADRLDQGGA